MNIFISWSGERSRCVAMRLRDWLPKVIQAVRPWMSEEDISTGTRWSSEIASKLEETTVGIICVTPENQNNAWLMFEAGALSKTLKETFVCPFLFDLTPSQLTGPIAQFQAVQATKEGTFKIINTLNNGLKDSKIGSSELEEIFGVWWPKLDVQLEILAKENKQIEVKRSTDDILEELLNISREQLRREETLLKAHKDRDVRIDALLITIQKLFKIMNKNSPLSMFVDEYDSLFGDDEIANNYTQLISSKEIDALIDLPNSLKLISYLDEIHRREKLKKMRERSKKESESILASNLVSNTLNSDKEETNPHNT